MHRYSKVIGTGGIGAGIIYRLTGNHDLGRNESRPAVLLDQKDFCKLHIIFHYIAKILKELQFPVKVFPIGAVGDDDNGKRLLALMQEAGMSLKYVKVFKDSPTLFGVCYTFPDGSGGNLGGINSASGRVNSTIIEEAEAELQNSRNQCLVLAAPEVPMTSRSVLLKLGRKYGAFTAASFVSEELAKHTTLKLLQYVDLLSINIDEAAMLAGTSVEAKVEKIIETCIEKAAAINAKMKLSITNGKHGAYAYENGRLEFLPSLKVKVANTAGAGDATLSGFIVGLVAGLPFLGNGSFSCFALARLFGAVSVQSADTINFAVSADSLHEFAKQHGQERVFNALIK